MPALDGVVSGSLGAFLSQGWSVNVGPRGWDWVRRCGCEVQVGVTTCAMRAVAGCIRSLREEPGLVTHEARGQSEGSELNDCIVSLVSVMVQPPSCPLSFCLPFVCPLGKPPSTLHFHPTLSTSTPPPFHSNSDAYVRNLYDYVAPTLGITVDQHRTRPDLVPTPRPAVCIPLLHLSYLSDPFSLPIMGNCFLV